jgi:Ni,Fe-hydrogenase III component G
MISEKLDQLAELQFQRDVMGIKKQELVNAILTPEIKAKLAEIEAEFSGQVEEVDQKISRLTEQIKINVLQEGVSVKGHYLHAVYQKGRVSWDTKKLEGLMMVIPQVSEARREGEPSVSIRKIERHDERPD